VVRPKKPWMLEKEETDNVGAREQGGRESPASEDGGSFFEKIVKAWGEEGKKVLEDQINNTAIYR